MVKFQSSVGREILSGILAAAALVLAGGCQRAKTPDANPMSMAVPVTVDTPQAGTVTNWDEYPGHLEAVETVDVRSQVTGYLESIHFKDGAEVAAGDALFTIDSRPFRAQLDQARAARAQAEVRLELAQADLRRATELRAGKAIPEEEFDKRRHAVSDLDAGLAAAKAAETLAQINLDYTGIKAPIAGKIGRRLVTPGNYVQAQAFGGGAVLATIVSLNPVYAYFDAQEEAFLAYAKLRATSPMPCDLALVDEEGYPHHGKIDFVDNQVERRTGTVRMRAVFDNADRTLVPGLFARIRVPAGPPVEALLIPDVAIQTDQGRKFVFVANSAGVAEARPVKTGRSHGDRRAILGGLTPTDRVVVDGLIMVRPGAKLQTRTVAEAAAAAAAMAAGAPK